MGDMAWTSAMLMNQISAAGAVVVVVCNLFIPDVRECILG
jgi:hypothetical protein